MKQADGPAFQPLWYAYYRRAVLGLQEYGEIFLHKRQ